MPFKPTIVKVLSPKYTPRNVIGGIIFATIIIIGSYIADKFNRAYMQEKVPTTTVIKEEMPVTLNKDMR